MGLESLVIHNPFSLQSFKKAGYVFRDLYRISRTVLARERCHNLLDRALAIAEFQDILGRTLYPDHAFREEHNLLFAVGTPSATWRQAGLAGL